MASLSNGRTSKSYKWFIILSFLGIIFVPGMMPSPTFKTAALGVLGAICLLFEFLSLKNLNSSSDNFKSEFRQTLLLIALTIALLGVNFVV